MSAAAIDLPLDRLLEIEEAVERAARASQGDWQRAEEAGDGALAEAAKGAFERFRGLQTWLREGREAGLCKRE